MLTFYAPGNQVHSYLLWLAKRNLCYLQKYISWYVIVYLDPVIYNQLSQVQAEPCQINHLASDFWAYKAEKLSVCWSWALIHLCIFDDTKLNNVCIGLAYQWNESCMHVCSYKINLLGQLFIDFRALKALV